MLALAARSEIVRDAPDARADSFAWDWSATTHSVAWAEVDAATEEPAIAFAVRDEILTGVMGALCERPEVSLLLPGKGLQGWEESVEVYDARGDKMATVYHGGKRMDVHVVATADHSNFVRPLVSGLYGAKTARVDTRVDTLLTFEELQEVCLEVAGPRTKVTYMESRRGDEALGRTLYVGAPTSDVRVRFYEKWLESPGQYEEGTNRVEVQLRPPSRGKAEVSGWVPGETFCATKLTRRLAGALSESVHKPGSLQKAKGTPDLERTLRSMGTQYGKAVDRWLVNSGGDVGVVLDHLTIAYDRRRASTADAMATVARQQ